MHEIVSSSWVAVFKDRLFLNQARAGRRLASTWFLRIALSMNVDIHVCVCVSAPEVINN